MKAKKCIVDGCYNKPFCKGYCTMHYQRVKMRKDPGPAGTIASTRSLVCKTPGCNNTDMYGKGLCRKCYRKQYVSPNKCSIEGCNEPFYAKSYCSMHWQRTRNNAGDPGPINSVKNSNGEGGLDANGYRVITISGERFLEHRYVMEQFLKRKLFPGENIHHINGDRSDNRIQNLELWTTNQPSGQRVEDKIKWAEDFLLQYKKTIS